MDNTQTPTYNVGAAILARRQALGLSQMAVVSKTSLPHPDALGRLERGSEASALLARLHEVAKGLNWTIEELVAASRSGQ